MSEETEKFQLAGASVAFNSFVRRQTAQSEFSHWTISDDEMINRVKDAALRPGGATKGYRDGVMLAHIKVESGDFYTGVIKLRDGDKLVGEYKARRKGEEPRKSLYVQTQQSYVPRKIVEKTAATHVDVVLYHHDVLTPDGDAETNSDWEIVSVNARDTEAEQPIHPMTLMHNHFGSDGGTDTKMTSAEFEALLREGFEYWKNRAMLAPKD